MPRRIAVLSVVAILTIMSGCSLFSPVKMEISPVSAVIFVGESIDFGAVGILPGGSEILQHNFVWELSSDIGTLSALIGTNTVITGQKAGSGILTVFNYDRTISASASVEVKDLPVLSRIVVEPTSCSIGDGQTQEFTAAGYDQYSQPFAVTPEWSVTGTIGTLSESSGPSTVLTAINPGSSSIIGTVVASSGSISGYSEITVSPAPPRLARIDVVVDKSTITLGESCGLSASGFDQYGDPFPVSPQWNALGDTKATFVPADGSAVTFSPALAQTATVKATSGSITGSTMVTVNPIRGYYHYPYPTIETIPIPDNGTVTISVTIMDANPKARITLIQHVMVNGTHELPTEVSAFCQAKDEYGVWRKLSETYSYLHQDHPNSVYINWVGVFDWEHLPVNTVYEFIISDHSVGNTGYIENIDMYLYWEQTEL